MWNAIRLHTEKGYGEGRPLDINGWMVLGDPLDDEVREGRELGLIKACERKFEGC